jgi:Xaa-Pro dipeptidase
MSEYLTALDQASGGNAQRLAELQQKYERLSAWLAGQGLDGILIRRHENLAWLTAGQLQARVGILSETGIVTLLVLRDGRRFALAPNNEMPRLAAEELPGLGYDPVQRPWHALNLADEARHLCPGKLAADAPIDAAIPVVSLAALRAPLHPAEIARLRVLATATSEVVTDTLLALAPGASEYEMEARTAERLLRQGIFPSVLLMATDERILHYKHAVARGQRLQRFGMLNLCTRRWGMVVSITRFVHFGPMPTELVEGFAAAAHVNAALQHATRSGATAASLFQVARQAYAAAGFPGEAEQHHQGGACGYLEREWVATPSGTDRVQTPQSFAWNPSCRGGKVEDTTLATESQEASRPGTELLTSTPRLPQITTEVAGSPYISAGVLVHD